MAEIERFMAETTMGSASEGASIGAQINSNVSLEQKTNTSLSSSTSGISSSVEVVRQAGEIKPLIIGQVPESVKIMGEVRNQLVVDDDPGKKWENDPGWEDIWGPEFRKLGISIATEIIKLEEKPYQEKYSDNGGKLNEFYKQWKKWVTKKEEQSYARKKFESPKETAQADQQEKSSEKVKPPEDSLVGLPSFRELLSRYNELQDNLTATPEQLADIKDQLSRYFNEAKRVGLLNGADVSLRSIYGEVMRSTGQKLAPDQVMGRMEERRKAILELGQRSFRAYKRSSSQAAQKAEKLAGVWEGYTDLAIDRFSLLLNGGGLVEDVSIFGEFEFGTESVEELRQFVESDDELRQRAGWDEDVFDDLVRQREETIRRFAYDREAFMGMAEDREVYWRPTYSNYFQVSARTPEQFQIAVDSFTQWLRSGLTKSPNEIFQRVSGFKDALTTAGVREKEQLEDPNLIVGLRRELEGLVGVLGADFANEHYNAQNYKQFMDFLAADEGPARLVQLSKAHDGRLVAVLHKLDKDPRFELLFSSHGSRGQLMEERNPMEQEELQEQIKAMLIAELMGINIKEYHPDDLEKRPGYKERNLNELARFQSDEEFRNLFEGFEQQDQDSLYETLERKLRAIKIQQDIDNKTLDLSSLEGEDKDIYEKFKGNLEITSYEKRLFQARKIQNMLQNGIDPNELRKVDKKGYEMYKEAENAFALAYEMYGVMGEKAKRGGGIFLIDRRDDTGRKFVDYMPIFWAEKFVQFAENWTKATYGGELDREMQTKLGVKGVPAEVVKNKVAQARKMAIWALKRNGFDAQLFDFTLTIGGKVVDPETFLGVDKYHQPLHPDMLGYNKNGKPITLTFDKDGKPEGVEFDAKGQAIIYKQPIADEKNRIYFDNFNINTRADSMMLKIARLQGKGSFGPPIPGKVPVDFQTAVNHIYSRWTGHPYWGYQEEDTGLLLTLQSFAEAKLIKEGKLRPEDARPHAVQLLIVDPTLERIGHFLHQEGREDVIALAAVEDSYQGHWRISDQLHQAFYPRNGDREDVRIAHNLQDFGSSTKQWFAGRAEAARWTDLKARRLRTMIPVLPLHFASMSEMWGAPGGVLDVLRMMNYKEYRMVGQFALEKWIGQTEAAQDLYEALFGFVDPQGKRSREGLGEKPNNDADALQNWYEKYSLEMLNPERALDEGIDNQFLNAVRKSLERLDIVFQRIRVLETDKRGERTPLWLEGIDIYERNPDGSIKINADGQKVFNRKIDSMRNTGSSRHSGEIFFWRFVKWMRSGIPGEGQDLYPTEATYYALMDQYTIASSKLAKLDPSKAQTRWEWLLGKINR